MIFSNWWSSALSAFSIISQAFWPDWSEIVRSTQQFGCNQSLHVVSGRLLLPWPWMFWMFWMENAAAPAMIADHCGWRPWSMSHSSGICHLNARRADSYLETGSETGSETVGELEPSWLSSFLSDPKQMCHIKHVSWSCGQSAGRVPRSKQGQAMTTGFVDRHLEEWCLRVSTKATKIGQVYRVCICIYIYTVLYVHVYIYIVYIVYRVYRVYIVYIV